jgi:hypothetical protein
MRRLEMTWLIHRPAEDVWKFVTNFDNWAKASLSKGEWRRTPEGPTELGTTVESSRKILGRSRHIHSYVVTEFEPYHAFGMTDKVPGLKAMGQRFTFEAKPEGTWVTRSVLLDLGRGRRLEPAFGWMLYRMWPVETATMTRLIEAGNPQPHSWVGSSR